MTGVLYVAEVVADSGSTVNMRKKADGDLLMRVPVGARVDVLEEVNASWARVRFGGTTGYVMRSFLRDVESVPDAPGATQTPGATVTVTLSTDAARELAEALKGVGL